MWGNGHVSPVAVRPTAAERLGDPHGKVDPVLLVELGFLPLGREDLFPPGADELRHMILILHRLVIHWVRRPDRVSCLHLCGGDPVVLDPLGVVIAADKFLTD